MKLSEALRLSEMAIPSMRGPIFTRGDDGNMCGACAIGGALVAAGAVEWPSGRHSGGVFEDVFPIAKVRAPYPLDPAIVADVHSLVIWLFEDELWSRSQIADFVETIEQSLESQVSRVLSPGEEEKQEKEEEYARVDVKADAVR